MIALGEFALGIFLLALSGLALSSKIWHWKRKDSLKLVRTLKSLGIISVFLGFAVCAIITREIKGESPWSHLSAICDRLVGSYWRVDELPLRVPLPKPPDFAFRERYIPRKAIPTMADEETPQRVFDLSEPHRSKLKHLLEQKEPREKLRVGCVYWSDAACVAAGEFLIVFSETGWIIDSAKVFRMESLIPKAGVAIVSRPELGTEKLPPLPPHLGRWHKMTPSEITIWSALRQLDIPVSGATESELPEGTIGVYFGPEPQHPSPMPPSEKDFFQKAPRSRK
jgi:hypothetical protein